MEPVVTAEELDRLEALPLAARAAALEARELELRAALDDADPA